MVEPKATSTALIRVGAVLATVALGTAAVLVNNIVRTSQATRTLPKTSPVANVRVARLEERIVARRAEFHGFLAPYEEISISADVVGEIVEQHVEVSSEVAKGQILYKIDDAVRRIRHEEAEAALDRAKSDHSLAGAQWDRVRALTGAQTTSIEHKQARSPSFFLPVRSSIRRRLRWTSQPCSWSEPGVTSPIDGIVSKVYQRGGEYTQLGLPLVRVIDVAPTPTARPNRGPQRCVGNYGSARYAIKRHLPRRRI